MEDSAPVGEVAPLDGLIAPEALIRPRQDGRPGHSARGGPGETSGTNSAEAVHQTPEVAEGPRGPADTGVDMAWLTSAIVDAGRATGDERRRLASEINQAFRRIGQAGGSRPVADVLIRELETGRLTGLVDAEGHTCRAAAVEALLSMGYPYALEVTPEDLAHLRENVGRSGTGPWLVGGVGTLVVSSGFELAHLMTSQLSPPLVQSGMQQVALGVAGAVGVALSRPGSLVRRLGGLGVTLACLWGAGLAGNGVGPALIGGLGALGAGLLLRRR